MISSSDLWNVMTTEAFALDQVEEKKQHLSRVEVRCFLASQRGMCVFRTVAPQNTGVFCKAVLKPEKKA